VLFRNIQVYLVAVLPFGEPVGDGIELADAGDRIIDPETAIGLDKNAGKIIYR
jgi:hypothetical protein